MAGGRPHLAEPSIIDLRTAPDPHRAATERMQADLAQDLRVDGGNPLVCHQLLRVGDDRWYWYQRYHHCWWMASASRR